MFLLQSRQLLRQLQEACLLAPSHLLPAPISASWVSLAQVGASCGANGTAEAVSLPKELSLFIGFAHWPDSHNFLCLQNQGPTTTPRACAVTGWVGRGRYALSTTDARHVPGVFITVRRRKRDSDGQRESLLLLDPAGRLGSSRLGTVCSGPCVLFWM